MKTLFTSCLLLFLQIGFCQNIKATTENGKKVLLKDDKTWEYDTSQTLESCSTPANFKEPQGDKSNKQFLEMTNATVKDMKKHVAVDLGVNEKDIVLLELSEQKGNAIYILCIKGTKYKYRRTGSVFHKDGEKP
ncbi:DUF3157 family protein [Flavobacterium sp. DGU11]|uniref:DUF3157 family protein n=1 Tax=Flavobacterium arundinis TaxID=3139143 RepID=A0ABU9I074_9FLAO